MSRTKDAGTEKRAAISAKAAAVSAEKRRWVPSELQRKEAVMMAAVGVSREQMSLYFGVSSEQLRRELGEEINKAEVQAVAKVASTLYKRATEGNDLGAAIFYLKARGGWRETQPVEVSQAQGIAIHIHL